jgi:hypothetical protein
MEGMRLRLEDLQVGDTVTKSSLDNIFNVYITLVDSNVIDGDIIGKIAFIGKELGDESDRVVEENDNICAIYHDSAEIEGEVTYDE